MPNASATSSQMLGMNVIKALIRTVIMGAVTVIALGVV
jgi:hypothetical protein